MLIINNSFCFLNSLGIRKFNCNTLRWCKMLSRDWLCVPMISSLCVGNFPRNCLLKHTAPDKSMTGPMKDDWRATDRNIVFEEKAIQMCKNIYETGTFSKLDMRYSSVNSCYYNWATSLITLHYIASYSSITLCHYIL